MKWIFALAAGAALLSGCAGHTVYLTGRTTGATAASKFRLAHSDTASFNLAGKVYSGRWVYMPQGGSVSIGVASAASFGALPGTATGSMIGLGMPTGAGGTFIGSAADGSSLRCSYTFSQWNLQGAGICEDSKGETYDMQIQ